MTGKVTVRMVAEAARVSLATVSRVLNNDPHVHTTTRTRVIRCAQQLGYQLEPGNGRRIIALVLPDGGDLRGYGGPLLANLRAEISMRKYRTELIGNTDIEILNDRVVSGAISLSLERTLPAAWADQCTLPLVMINFAGDHLNHIYTVRSDGEQGIELALNHLWQKGHRKIAYLSDQGREHELELCSRRYPAFRRLMAAHGEPDPPEFFHIGNWPQDGSILRRLRETRTTALLCVGEPIGIALTRNLQKAGVRIPEDFSLLAMEYPSVSENLVPSHTTLAQNFKRLASEAVNLLEKIMNHSPGLKDIDIPYTLIERESVLDISRRGPDGAAPPPSGS